MVNMNYTPVAGMILNISGGSGCCSQMMSLRAENGIINFAVGRDTLVIDDRQLRPGMRATAFYDSSLPVPMIFPPQYRAQLVAVLGRNEQVKLDYFDRNLLSGDRSLQLNIGRSTVIRTVNGQSFTCDPGGRVLLVYYTAATRSMPPQATPGKVIVLC